MRNTWYNSAQYERRLHVDALLFLNALLWLKIDASQELTMERDRSQRGSLRRPRADSMRPIVVAKLQAVIENHRHRDRRPRSKYLWSSRSAE